MCGLPQFGDGISTWRTRSSTVYVVLSSPSITHFCDPVITKYYPLHCIGEGGGGDSSVFNYGQTQSHAHTRFRTNLTLEINTNDKVAPKTQAVLDMIIAGGEMRYLAALKARLVSIIDGVSESKLRLLREDGKMSNIGQLHGTMEGFRDSHARELHFWLKTPIGPEGSNSGGLSGGSGASSRGGSGAASRTASDHDDATAGAVATCSVCGEIVDLCKCHNGGDDMHEVASILRGMRLPPLLHMYVGPSHVGMCWCDSFVFPNRFT